MARTAIATDDFNRAGPALGSNWTNMDNASPGDILIDSSVKYRGQYGVQAVERRACARWVGTGAFTADQYSSAFVSGTGTVPSAAAAVGVICRASGNAGTRTFYELLIVGDGTGIPFPTTLCKWVSGVRTLLYSAEISWVDGDEISLECEGTTIRACRNGVPLGGSWTVTDASISTGAPGVAASSTQMFGDNWEGGNITAPASVLGGNVTLDDATPGGGLSSVASSLGGNVTLDDVAPAGTLGAVPGTFTSEALKDWTGAVQSSTALTYYRLYNPSTGALVVSRTGLSTDGAGVVSFTDAAISAGTSYASDWLTAGGARRMPIKAAT